MEIRIDTTGPYVVAGITGMLTTQHAEAFTERLQEFVHGDGAVLAIELSQLTMLDSTGLSAMIGLVTRSRLSNGRVVLIAPSPFVRGILEVTHLDAWFEVFASHEEASEQLSKK